MQARRDVHRSAASATAGLRRIPERLAESIPRPSRISISTRCHLHGAQIANGSRNGLAGEGERGDRARERLLLADYRPADYLGRRKRKKNITSLALHFLKISVLALVGLPPTASPVPYSRRDLRAEDTPRTRIARTTRHRVTSVDLFVSAVHGDNVRNSEESTAEIMSGKVSTRARARARASARVNVLAMRDNAAAGTCRPCDDNAITPPITVALSRRA